MTVNEYLKLPYHIIIHYNEEDNIYYPEVRELKGCLSQGYTPEMARENALKAMRLWIETALERGIEIPLPEED